MSFGIGMVTNFGGDRLQSSASAEGTVTKPVPVFKFD